MMIMTAHDDVHNALLRTAMVLNPMLLRELWVRVTSLFLRDNLTFNCPAGHAVTNAYFGMYRAADEF